MFLHNAKVKLNSITLSYVPKRASNNDPEFCSCGFNKIVSQGNCRFCRHELRNKIKEVLRNVRSFKFKILRPSQGGGSMFP